MSSRGGRQQGVKHRLAGLFRGPVGMGQGVPEEFEADGDVPVAVLDESVGVKGELGTVGHLKSGRLYRQAGAQAQWG